MFARLSLRKRLRSRARRRADHDGLDFWRHIARVSGSVLLTLLISGMLVFSVELIARGDFEQTLLFFQQPFKPSWTTILLFALLIMFFDALLGRAFHAVLLITPIAFLLAFVGHQKAFYLGDPLYPTDFLYARQIVELMPLLVRQRPLTAIVSAVVIILAIAFLVSTWRFWRRRARLLSFRERGARLAIALPALIFFGSIMDYATFSWARDRLQIIPMMWDQRENYNSNGFAIAFALNVPMAKVGAPPGYSEDAMKTIIAGPVAPVSAPEEKPDIIMVMSESFWDPTKLPNVSITPDPIPTVRALQSGTMFSPEFGGMTANVEFEALTGFSNAFLPYGSIPYQQYIRSPTPSLAQFLKTQGYITEAFHPFAGWFWNRAPVYKDFGFDRFLSEESLPYLAKRGPLASDAALTDIVISEADATSAPFFYFVMTLQGHGPYEPHRYPSTPFTLTSTMTQDSRESLMSYTVGAGDADTSLGRLIDWAKARERPTVIAFFGDHLPPLGNVYTETGFMKDIVADRKAPAGQLAQDHQTPLVIWSNRQGVVKNVGSISPAFLPMVLMRTAGFSHPYFTGFLGEVHDRYKTVDRNMLIGSDGGSKAEWSREKDIDPAIRDFRYLQYDVMFGKRLGEKTFFPNLEQPMPAEPS